MFMETTIAEIKENFYQLNKLIIETMSRIENLTKIKDLTESSKLKDELADLMRRTKFDDNYITNKLPNKIDVLVKRIEAGIPRSIRNDKIEEIRRSLDVGVTKLAKYLRSLRNMIESIYKRIKPNLSGNDLLLIRRTAGTIKNGYIYSEKQLDTLFNEIETLKGMMETLDHEQVRVKQFLEREYAELR